MISVSRLTCKFVVCLSVIFAAVAALSLLLNQHFINRYQVYQEKQEMNQICDRLLADTAPLPDAIAELERTEDVVIAWAENTTDNNVMNEKLRNAFFDKGISLKQYWLWDEDQQQALEGGRKIRIYSQERLHYSLLVIYFSKDRYFLAAAKIIPATAQTLSLINQVTIVIFTGAMVIMIFLLTILVRRIISPLKAIGDTAEAIAAAEYKTVEIHTNDELETLADAINDMSRKLKETHESLEQKNKQMQELLGNVSHDLKTPVALIKAYASGMKDGMDDGTFLDTIVLQNNRMGQMIERLLDFAKMQQTKGPLESFNLSRYLTELIQDYRLAMENQQIVLHCELEDTVMITANKDAIYMILSNLLSNAVNYTFDKHVTICLYRKEEQVVFQISNKTDSAKEFDLEHLWEPFVVGEESRNKDLSGTGLGLPIVKAAAEQYGLLCDCSLHADILTFTIRF